MHVQWRENGITQSCGFKVSRVMETKHDANAEKCGPHTDPLSTAGEDASHPSRELRRISTHDNRQ